MIAHHFTIDVEEYFQVSAFESRVARRDWGSFASRVEEQMERLLALLAQHEVRATCFVVGWLAAQHPALIKRIAGAGHEIASHTWDHARVTQQTPVQFRDSVRRAKLQLEELTGAPVLGFRAPSYSIVPGYEWALDILLEEGHRYDSSLFPVRRKGYGYPGGRADYHWVERPVGRIAEIPPSTLQWWRARLPAAGGAYFRLLPYGLVRAAFKQCERLGVAGTFYIHPWELDPDQPRFDVSWRVRLRHYGGLTRTVGRLERLLGEFRFTTIRDSVASSPRTAVLG
jgi:polysaccharide deacetylase family protein (PEP-CTERM system associated)